MAAAILLRDTPCSCGRISRRNFSSGYRAGSPSQAAASATRRRRDARCFSSASPPCAGSRPSARSRARARGPANAIVAAPAARCPERHPSQYRRPGDVDSAPHCRQRVGRRGWGATRTERACRRSPSRPSDRWDPVSGVGGAAARESGPAANSAATRSTTGPSARAQVGTASASLWVSGSRSRQTPCRVSWKSSARKTCPSRRSSKYASTLGRIASMIIER